MKKTLKCKVCGREDSCGHRCEHCGSYTNVIAGRWIFHCDKKECKERDWGLTYDNELDGREDWTGLDGELSGAILKNMG